jgi:hypothetical protein
MPRFRFIGQAARSFGNDLQASRDGVNSLDVVLERGAIEPRREIDGEGRCDAGYREGRGRAI